MPFSAQVQDHHRLEWGENFEMLLRYKGSKLRPFVSEKACAGKGSVAANLIGDINYQRRRGRKRSNIENIPPRSRRWLSRTDPIETGQYFDEEDEWDMIGQPKSELYKAHVNAIRRGVDDVILGIDENGEIMHGGLLGAATEGERPSTTVAFPTANKTLVGGTGLTIGKLRAARKKLGLDENDLDVYDPTMAISTKEHDDLLGIVETASANLNMLEQPHIVEGKVKRLLGFNFVETNRLPVIGGVRQCPVWLKDGICLGIWKDVTTDMYNDTHAGNTPYASAECVMDAVRVQDDKVHVIESTE